jgi:hypothetical protein
MGAGTALVEVPFGPRVVYETTSITTFMAPIANGHLGLLFNAEGKTPISAQIVFSGLVLAAPAPFGGRLDTLLPPVPSVPAGPNAVVAHLRSTIGPQGLLYREHTHGRTIAYKPKGIVLPRKCPHGGFPFAAEFSFEDGSSSQAKATVPCPVHRRSNHRS